MGLAEKNLFLNGLIVNNRCCSLMRLKIIPERIHFLKFILEGYDGMALLSTEDAGQGLVEIRYPPEIEKELKQLLHTIKPQITKNIT
jgi:Domain of unknown function (DUF4911)